MKRILRCIAAFAVVASTVLLAQEPMSDEEFSQALEELRSNTPRAIFLIAYSKHPRALEVLQNIEEFMEVPYIHRTWGEFRRRYGYPQTPPESSTIQINSRDLTIALAAAGDDEAFYQIVEGYDELSMSQQSYVLNKLIKVRSDRAVRFVASQLTRDSGDPALYPFGQIAASVLQDIVGIQPGIPSKELERNMQESREWVQLWIKWWSENAVGYGAEPPNVSSQEAGVSNGTPPLDEPYSEATPLGHTEVAEGEPETEGPYGQWLLALAVIAAVGAFMLYRQRST